MRISIEDGSRKTDYVIFWIIGGNALQFPIYTGIVRGYSTNIYAEKSLKKG